MILLTVAFWLFLVLTLAFACALLWRLWPRPLPANTLLDTHAQAMSNVVAQGPGADSVKEIAEAVSTVLKAIGDFGSKLDSLGPVAVLGVFTIVFALLTLTSAWMSK
jgi:hypothetical protein